MDSSGEGGRSEAARLKLAERYPEPWQLWRLGKVFHAWRRNTSPAWKLAGRDWEHLGARMDVFVKTYEETGDLLEARDAAADIE